MANPTPNAWCRRLGVDGIDVDVLAQRKTVNLRHLIMAALLERGEPMTLDQLAARIARLRGRGSAFRLRTSLVKAWKGEPPLYRDADGRFGFDPDARECRVAMLYLFPDRWRARTPAPPPPLSTGPLAVDELERGLPGSHVHRLSAPRLYAAVIDARGGPMTREEVEAFLAPLLPDRHPCDARQVSRWGRSLAAYGEDGRVHLLDAPDQLRKMRLQVRGVLRDRLAELAREEAIAASHGKWEQHAAEAAERARSLERGILHGLVVDGEIAALTVLRPRDRSLRTLVGAEVVEASSLCEPLDVVVGLGVRDVIERLAFDTEGKRLVDLRSAPKSKRLNRQGRTLQIKAELLIRSSIDVSRPLGDTRKMVGYLRSGQRTKLVRRLESDAKTLAAWYAYGVLHRAVRLRWGFLDDMLPVSWAEECDPYPHAVLGGLAKGRQVEVVLRTAPGWKSPWARARVVRSYDAERRVLDVESEHGTEHALVRDIVTIRERPV